MAGARVWWKRSIRHTIWNKDNLGHVPERYHFLYTLVLPLKYLAIALYGALSYAVPVSSIDLTFGYIYGDMWSIGLLAGGVGAFVGLCFYPRLLWAECVSAVLLVTLMVVYVGCIFVAALSRAEDFRYLSLILVFIFLPMPSWRVYDIVRELRPARVLN